MDSRIADISLFSALQNVKPKMSAMAVFNINVEDIKTSVEEWMDEIDVLRELQADVEAEAEESKLEKMLESTNQRIKSSISSARTTITELKRSGALDEEEDSELPSDDESEMNDFDSLASKDDVSLEGDEGAETESIEADDENAETK